ncbi:uncharacterized protein MELLADRAFT_88351 [Melampsora larici-populina 98AG31]|uniref:TFIIS N-terminal domain-containing protein n=1 Tax=Melampsora larici-populina (strain 98AG31 / pathotype 3-4-7) TaxID=747676 RepID=F4RRE6_MELLP|nr:uncharacterized protein MELLADRAFT_88351 [Melampsora larici-populina 98AG31]EGG04924.1 hypothetical protein MELLADRAFT_88351 [Melampsora larici-populina 98AG31]
MGDWSTVPPEGRLEILSAINASADGDLFKSLASQKTWIVILEACSTFSTKDVILKNTLLLSLLKMFRRIPITLEILKNYTFATKVMQINKNSTSHRFSDNANVLAGKLVHEWRQMVKLEKTRVDKITNELSTRPKIPHKPTRYLTFPVQIHKPAINSNTSMSTTMKNLTPRVSRRTIDTLETPRSFVLSKFNPQRPPTPKDTPSKATQSPHRVRGKPSLKASLKDMNTRLLSSSLQDPGKERKVKQARFASDEGF